MREAHLPTFKLHCANESVIAGLEAALREYVQRHFRRRSRDVTVTIVGHSLGGYKAQVGRCRQAEGQLIWMGCSRCVCAQKLFFRLLTAPNPAARLAASCISFDSPGLLKADMDNIVEALQAQARDAKMTWMQELALIKVR